MRLRKSGATIPLTDTLIASVAIRNGASVYTRDKHFNYIKEVTKIYVLKV